MGYAKTRLISLGRFIADEIEIRSPPATLMVSANAADMVGPFRSSKTRSWDETTLGQLVDAIASEHRYQAKIEPELAAIAIHHLDQTEESDMALLTRLATKHDAVAKPEASFLAIDKLGSIKTITGLVMPTINLNARDLAEWRYQHSARKPGGSGATSDRDTQKPPTTV